MDEKDEMRLYPDPKRKDDLIILRYDEIYDFPIAIAYKGRPIIIIDGYNLKYNDNFLKAASKYFGDKYPLGSSSIVNVKYSNIDCLRIDYEPEMSTREYWSMTALLNDAHVFCNSLLRLHFIFKVGYKEGIRAWDDIIPTSIRSRDEGDEPEMITGKEED